MDKDQEFPIDKEKRQTCRVKGAMVEYSTVEYSIGVDNKETKTAFLKDLCSGGISMFVGEEIEVGTCLYLAIYLSSYKGPIMAKGEVIWLQDSVYLKKSSKKHYDVGIKFFEISDKNETAISQYVTQYVEIEDE